MNEILENSWHRWVDVRVKVVVGGGGVPVSRGSRGVKKCSSSGQPHLAADSSRSSIVSIFIS